MVDALHTLATSDLISLRDGVASGRLTAPFTSFVLQQYCARESAGLVADRFQGLSDSGATTALIHQILDMLIHERQAGSKAEQSVDLVLTGPEIPGTTFRDTSVVVRELFTGARRSVVIVGYAVYQGKSIFESLAQRMEQDPSLEVEMYLDIQRRYGDTTKDSELIRGFAAKFRTQDWPWEKVPDVYYDPRSLNPDRVKRSSLHAKCIVVDSSVAFVSSANFTEAAQVRNIEAGVLIRSPHLALKLERHFKSLAEAEELKRLWG